MPCWQRRGADFVHAPGDDSYRFAFMRGRSARLPPAHCGLRMSAWSTCWLAPSRGRVCAGAPLRRSAPKARRLRCGARVSVALRNSLHSLRSLRSDSRSESVHEVRGYARRPKPCAPRRRTGAPAHTRPRLGEAPVFFVGEGHKPGIEPGSRPASAPAARGKPRARCPWLAQHSPPRTTVPARRRVGSRRGEWRRREAQG